MSTEPTISHASKPWRRPGMLVGSIGLLLVIAGSLSPMPDALSGWVFGGMFILAALAMLLRAARRREGLSS